MLSRLVDDALRAQRQNLVRGRFRVRGDTIEVHPAYEEYAVRIELFGDEIERVSRFDVLTGELLGELEELIIFPATHYVAGDERTRRAIASIEVELGERLASWTRPASCSKRSVCGCAPSTTSRCSPSSAAATGSRTTAATSTARQPGEAALHAARLLPRRLAARHRREPRDGPAAARAVRRRPVAQGGARRARVPPPVRQGQPAAALRGAREAVSTSASSCRRHPSEYEVSVSSQVVEQIVRPTGLVDPEVVIKPTKGQIDDLIAEINTTIARGERVLVTTLTKKMAEDLADYLLETGLKVRYLHSNIDTIERIEIIRDLRLGEFDVLVGINLLREGLDLPEVSLVAILDADKEGFLRSKTSLIQTMGRAARNVSGRVDPLRGRDHRLDARAPSPRPSAAGSCRRSTTGSTGSTRRRSARR